MARLLARISSSFHLQWFTLMWTGCQGISKLTNVAKIAKKRQNGQKYKISSNRLLVGVFDINGMFATISPSFHLHTTVIYHDLDIKSSQNDQKNAKHYQISSKLVGASGINGLLAPISYFHLQWIYPDVDRLSRDTKSEFTITEWPQGRARCAAPSALLLLCFPPKPELATVQWDNQIGDPNFKIRDPLKWEESWNPTSFGFTITNLEQRWKPKL